MVCSRTDMEAIYEKYKNSVFSIGFNYFKNSTDADDVVQETFLKLYREILRGKIFESEDHLRNWLIRVAVNECKRVTLSTWMKKKVNIEEFAGTVDFSGSDETGLFEAVMNLPKKYRQVVHLYYFEDYSTAEIGKILGLSQSAVSTRLLRARKLLKVKLAEGWKDE